MEIEIKAEKQNEKEGKYEEYEIKCWAEKLLEAEEIKNDPEKMALVKPYLDNKVKAIRSIADLKAVAKKKISEEAMSDSEDSDD